MATDPEKKAAKAKKTKAANIKKQIDQEKQLRRAQATARNAKMSLKEYKAGFADGLKASQEMARVNN